MQSMFIYRVGVYAIESSRVESSQVGDFMNMNILVSQVCAYVCKCMYMYVMLVYHLERFTVDKMCKKNTTVI